MLTECFLLDYRICFLVANSIYDSDTDLVWWDNGFGK